jgi:Putative DNA-binding domain
MNATLTQQIARDQAALLQSIMGWPAESDATAVAQLHVVQHRLTPRGLNAYRANAHAAAVRALRAAYPALVLMLGDESFDAMAQAFWHAHLPQQGDWAVWGGALAAFLERDEQLADVPYLADVARLEWQLHEIATAPDAYPNAQAQTHTFARLIDQDPDTLGLHLAAHCPVWQSLWPVVSLVQAHTFGPAGGIDEALMPVARGQLEAGASQNVLVWRSGWRPCLREALRHEPEFLSALKSGQSLGQALAQAPELDFALWLQTAIQTRLLLAVTSI